MNTTLRTIESVLIITIVFLMSFIANVYLHEFGHYVAADTYNLHPKITIEPVEESLQFTLESKALAYTEFDETKTNGQKAIIAIMGPLVNLLIVLICIIAYFQYGHIQRLQTIIIGALIPSIFAFVINIIPFAASDGAMILQALI